MRGDYAWMGFAWQGCTNATASGAVQSPFRRPPELDAEDHGVPLGLCVEESPGVFVREWSKATARMDCNAFKGTITMKKAGAAETGAATGGTGDGTAAAFDAAARPQ
jgi:hypothetical protein